MGYFREQKEMLNTNGQIFRKDNYSYTKIVWLGKHIPAEANARNNMTSVARQRISKHTFLKIKFVFSVWSVKIGYKEELNWVA
jgi:hypothetical protein